MQSINIKPLTSADVEKYLEKIVDMQTDNTYKFHYPNKTVNREYVKTKILEMKEHLEKGNTLFLGAFDGDKLFGYLWTYFGIFIDEKRLHVNSLYIDEEYRKCGVATMLFDKTVEWAKQNGCTEMAVHCASFNTNAAAFYKKCGFEPKRIELFKEL